MKRPQGLPRVGSVIHHPTFGGGATIKVNRILPPRESAYPQASRGWRVSVAISLDDNGRIENRGRCWSLATWQGMADDANEPTPPAAAPTHGEGV